MIHCIGCAARKLSGRGLVAVALTLTSLLPTGCASLEKSGHLLRHGAEQVTTLPGWPEESAAGLREALFAQCRLARLKNPWPGLCRELSTLPVQAIAPAAPVVNRGNKTGNVTVRAHEDAVLKRWVNEKFEAWQLTNPRGAGNGLLTGYYEPLLTGSLHREQASQVPIFAKPTGLVNADPAATREMIENGSAAAQLNGLELLWLDDPVDAFFLHIQGSGRVRLRDGQIIRAGYAGHNGHSYFAIGRELISNGAIRRQDMSADAIKQWLRAHPDQARAMMWRNPRYIFFKLISGLPADTGPAGSLQVPLTSLRSVATDKRFVPAGALLYLDTRLPVGTSSRVGLTLTQDTGSAIRGPVRADLFTGTGESAGKLAGRLNQSMRAWLLWPRGQTPPPRIPVARQVINP